MARVLTRVHMGSVEHSAWQTRPDKDQNYQARISALLLERTEKFDRQIGEAVIAICTKTREAHGGPGSRIGPKGLGSPESSISRYYASNCLVNRSQDM
jgi:hypothetical protein